jgi:hypothetical protein
VAANVTEVDGGCGEVKVGPVAGADRLVIAGAGLDNRRRQSCSSLRRSQALQEYEGQHQDRQPRYEEKEGGAG